MKRLALLAPALLAAALATPRPHAAPAPHGPSAPPPAWASALEDTRKFQLAPGLRLEVWAAEPQLSNAVAFSLAPLPPPSPAHPPGVAAYLAETHRYGISVFDITQNTPWLLDDLSFRTVEDRTAFLSRQYPTNLALLTRDSEIVRRVADADADGRAEESALFAEGFNSVADGTAAGILAGNSGVWFANIPNLWRLGEPRPGSPARQALATGFGVHIGVTGHDLHGLVLGPDGRLYMSFGDRGLDVTPRGTPGIHLPDTGGVLRCEPDGRHLEVFCTGLRNPQELAFDDTGNLFTVDNDTAGADDCRVLHLVEGADYGWRASYQHMKGFGPWVREGLWAGGLDGILPPAGKVSQGPAGLAWYPGTGFGDRFRGRFLHADFPGGIWSFGLVQRGASHAVTDPQKVLWNCWPTDVEFGPDGALYVLDWVAGWGIPHKGRIYRVTDGTSQDPGPDSVGALLAGDPRTVPGPALLERLGHPDRRVRLDAQFELARRGPDSFHALRRVAFEAGSALPRLHALWAIGQIARGIDPGRAGGDFSDELASLLPLIGSADDTVAGTAARVLAEAALAGADLPLAAMTRAATARLRFDGAFALGTLMTPSRRSGTAPAATAGRGPDPATAFHPGWDALREFSRTQAPGDPFLAFAAVRHAVRLEGLEAGWPSHRGISGDLARNLRDPSPGVRQVAILALRRLTNGALAELLADREPLLALEAARAIHDVPIPDALPALAAELDRRRDGEPNPDWLRIPDVTLADHYAAPGQAAPLGVRPPTNTLSLRQQFLRRALDAHFRVGHPTNALALAAFASIPTGAGPAMPAALRVEALFLLSRWEVTPASPGHVPATIVPDPNHGMEPSVNPENWPGWFDRVTGLWRPLPPRPPEAARAALAPRLDSLLSDPDPAVAIAAAEAATRLRIPGAAPLLLTRLQDPGSPIQLRRTVPGALAALDSPLAGDATRLALQDPDPGLRAAAVPHLDRLPPGTAIPLLAGLLEEGLRPGGSLPLAQAAITALGRRPETGADPVILGLLERRERKALPASVELETLEAARARTHPQVLAQVARIDAARPAGDPLGGWADTLVGGDPQRGRAVFFEKAEVQCSRCHRVKGEGGTVGPALDGLGTRAPREQILESILQPNARFAPGFENALLTLSDGREISGTVKRESATELEVATGEDGDVRVAKASVTGRRPGLSAMPEGLGALLARRELRDLVAYLATRTE